jgi:small subunit ribosomal protein S4
LAHLRRFELRNFPPGQHGVRNTRRKLSEYGTALAEKQKLKFQYGVLEKQFRLMFAEAQRRKGVTGEILLQMLEQRLDNVVYRMGFANTRFAARQAVSHGHITVNGKRVNISSYQVQPGDVVAAKSTAKSQQLVGRFLEMTLGTPVPDWVTVDRDKMSGVFNRVPCARKSTRSPTSNWWLSFTPANRCKQIILPRKGTVLVPFFVFREW